MKRYRAYPLLLLWLVLGAGCAGYPVTARREAPPVQIGTEQEVLLGGYVYGQGLQQMGGVYPDAALNAYLDHVGQRLARTSHRPELTWHFRMVNDATADARALPGGYVMLTRGLLLALENEAQLAAVLAHEIGHVSARHSVRELQRGTLSGVFAELLGTEAGAAGYVQLLSQAGEMTTNLLKKSYSPDQEYEADRLMVDYLVRAGYALQGSAQLQDIYLRTADANANSDRIGGMLRTHPHSGERLALQRQYMNNNHAGYRGAAGLDNAAYRRQIQSLESTRAAYELYDQARAAEAREDLGTAITTYHKAVQQAPEHGLLLSALGMAYLRNEDMIPARRYLQRAVTVDPGYFQSRMGLGYIHLRNNQWDDAAQHFDASLQLMPTVQGTFLLAEAEEGRGNVQRARQLYQTVVQVDAKSRLGQAAAARLKSMPR